MSFDFESFIIGLLCLIFFFAYILLDHLNKLSRNHNMHLKIGWIAEKDNNMMCYKDSVRLRNKELILYILEEQHNLNVPKEFCIDFSNKKEIKNAEEILDLYKNDVIKSYFHGLLTKSKNICKLDSLEYYFYSLYNFIYEELDTYKNDQDKIYMNRKHIDDSYSICQLTNYGRTYYKLYLITNIFIENNKKTRKLFEYINPDLKKHIMEYLEKNEVCFWHYRP